MGRLDGKIAIVTGAARGMGAAIAKRFTDEGAFVALTDILPEVDATAAALGPRAVAFRHDVADDAAKIRPCGLRGVGDTVSFENLVVGDPHPAA